MSWTTLIQSCKAMGSLLDGCLNLDKTQVWNKLWLLNDFGWGYSWLCKLHPDINPLTEKPYAQRRMVLGASVARISRRFFFDQHFSVIFNMLNCVIHYWYNEKVNNGFRVHVFLVWWIFIFLLAKFLWLNILCATGKIHIYFLLKFCYLDPFRACEIIEKNVLILGGRT